MISNLAHFGPAGAAAKADVLNWSQSLDHWVRLGALEAYVAIEEHKDALITFLLAALMDANQLVRRSAARYLGDVGQGRPEVFAALVNLLDEPISQTGAILSLGKIGMEKQQTLPLLTEKLHDENPVVRRCAAFGLGDVGGHEAFTALMESTVDPDGFVREAVFQSLQRINPDALQRSGKRFY
jgi:HEAT repeat protein